MTDQDMLDQIPDGVVVIGPGRTITALNRTASRMTGWSAEDAIGKPWGDVVRLRDAGGFLVHERSDPFDVAPPMSKGTPEREYMLHTRDGGSRWIAIRTSLEHGVDGSVVSVVATLRDAGRRHRVERSAYDLIATLAHDLRSPLTSVKGFTSTMLRRWNRFSDEQKQHMLETIDFDADRMARLLRDLLDLSRLEAGRLEIRREEIDAAAMAKIVTERVAIDATMHSLSVEFSEPLPPVSADPGKVEQVLTNLVENAVKHGDPGKVTVSGSVENGAVLIRVADSGPGIDPRHVPYVFTKFYRRSTGERHHGTGLGLYICKGIIEAHGGDIRVEHSDPSGTVFAFTLPIDIP